VSARFLALIGWIREELAEIARSAQRARELCEKALRTGDDGYWDGVALNLHGFYTGAERIFEEIAREIDGHRPGGPDWHRDLADANVRGDPGHPPAGPLPGDAGMLGRISGIPPARAAIS
jgi:hypothetical protein